MALTLLTANNAQTVLAAGISASATTLTVNTGTGSLFPSPVSGTSYFKLTLIDATTGQLTEIVHVTARTGDTMTISRAQEGTTARAWSANDIAANMLTAGTIALLAPLDSPVLTGTPTAPTASAGTNTTQLATTAFVGNAITAASGRLLNNGPLIFNTPGVTTYTPSALMKFCIVEVLGAGGGSGGCPATSASQIAAAAGGAGGSWARVSLTAAQVGSSQAVTVGAGGAAGTTSGSGGVGGSSSFGTLIVCPGGTATLVGVAISTSTASVISGANPGGVPTIISGTIIESMNGMAGGNAYLSFSNVLSGIGGASPRGNGGNGISGVTASGYGSGGSGNGSTASQSAKTGQAGTGGYVAIWEYA
ncbi:hypothetical protein [Phytobacter diazotrophicus]|uniref:glycine-rich domain-containing protein n=1 Tax=Phytobacter diazotrophicus TaxID=395631 RepID=UPI002FFA0867